jgi:hypothetical protein
VAWVNSALKGRMTSVWFLGGPTGLTWFLRVIPGRVDNSDFVPGYSPGLSPYDWINALLKSGLSPAGPSQPNGNTGVHNRAFFQNAALLP